MSGCLNGAGKCPKWCQTVNLSTETKGTACCNSIFHKYFIFFLQFHSLMLAKTSDIILLVLDVNILDFLHLIPLIFSLLEFFVSLDNKNDGKKDPKYCSSS